MFLLKKAEKTILLLVSFMILSAFAVCANTAQIGEAEMQSQTAWIYHEQADKNPNTAHGLISWQLGSSAGGTFSFSSIDDGSGNKYARTYLKAGYQGDASNGIYARDAEYAFSLEPNSNDPTKRNPNASYGLTNETFASGILKFEIRLVTQDINQNDDRLKISFGYVPTNTQLQSSQRRMTYLDVSDYIQPTSDWQYVEIPLNLFDTNLYKTLSSGSEATDWSKFFMFLVSYPLKTEPLKDVEVWYKNIRVEYVGPTTHTVEFGVASQNASGEFTDNLAAGDTLQAKASFSNRTTTDKEVMLMLAVYKDGFLVHIDPVTAMVAAGTTGLDVLTSEYILDNNLTGYEVAVYLWSDFMDGQAYVDELWLGQ